MTRAHAAAALAALVVTVLGPTVPARGADPDDARERAMVESLRREDPSAADRYVALRDAREQAMADVRRVEKLYNASAPEVRPLFMPQLRQAQRRYAEASLALLDFFDERDRHAITSYQEEIGRINQRLEEHRRMRAELEQFLK